MTDEKIEYRKGQIWLDTVGTPVLRRITDAFGTHDAWFLGPDDRGSGEVQYGIPEYQMNSFSPTLIYNPPQEWAVGDVVPVGTDIDRGWVGQFGPDNGVYQKPHVFDPHERNIYEATILWIDTKEN